MVPVFVISLKRSIQRREKIASLFSKYNIEFEFIDAVEGSGLSPNEVDEVSKRAPVLTKNFVNKMSPSEVGCAYSHVNVYKQIINKGISCAVILEDDVIFDHRFKEFIHQLDKVGLPGQWFELALLGYSPDNKNYYKSGLTSIWGTKNMGKFNFGRPVNWYWGAYAYILTHSGAAKLIKASQPFRMPADILTTNCPNYAVDMGIIKTPVVWPGPENLISTIGIRPQDENRVLLHSSRNLLARIINSNSITRNIKISIYRLQAFLKQKQVYIRIFIPKPAKYYIKNF